jgi:signal transduction histidine kinase
MAHQPAPKLPHAAETRRIAALRSYDVLDTPREATFDDIVLIASTVCRTPIAVVNLIDAERQWFKAEIGLGTRETPLDTSICAHAILEHDVLIIPDTTQDARFAANPLVVGDPGLRFYAGALLKTPDGMPIGTVCVLDTVARELTADQVTILRALARQAMLQMELRKMHSMAEHTSTYRARMLASAGHDFKAPLRSALYSVTRARRAANAEQLERLATAEEELHKIDQGFNRLISAASGNSTFSVDDLLPVPLNDVLQQIETSWGRAAERKGIQLQVASTDLVVVSNAALLETLLGNLVANAVKYTPRNGQVSIGCKIDASLVLIEVADTGIGIPANQVDELFGAFRQANAQVEGLGLGLWIVRQTAEALDVKIDVTSVEGEGTQFHIRVPRSITEAIDDISKASDQEGCHHDHS